MNSKHSTLLFKIHFQDWCTHSKMTNSCLQLWHESHEVVLFRSSDHKNFKEGLHKAMTTVWCDSVTQWHS